MLKAGEALAIGTGMEEEFTGAQIARSTDTENTRLRGTT